MPDGAEGLTAHEAEERIVPNGATGAQGPSGATARPLSLPASCRP